MARLRRTLGVNYAGMTAHARYAQQILFWRSTVVLKTIFIILALVCFIIEALGKRVKFRTGFSLLPAGLAFLSAYFLV